MPQVSRYIRVVHRDRSRSRPAVRSISQNPERQIMTLGCEIKANLRPESRFSPDDITRFGDADDHAAVAEFAARFCNHFDNYMQRHGKGHGMCVKRDLRCTSGCSTALWTIERDGSIRKNSPRQVPMRIVSPTMVYDMTQWRDAVKSMYRSVGDRYLFEANESCGLHIHLKPSVSWNMKDLRALSRAIVYFEPCLQSLLPSHRARGEIDCKQNYTENPVLRSESIRRCFEIINGMSSITDLKDVMNSDRSEAGHTKYYAWNFMNLSWNAEKQRVDGTVEYRSPPYANNATECLAWMELAVTFASAARIAADRGAKIRKRFSRDLPGLRDFLEYGAVQWTHRSDYERLFPRRRR